VFEVGDVVGSYTILAHLRSGGMADLFLARREGAMGFRRLVAVKVVHPRHAEDDHLVRMFLDEALISARIDHPNVVHVEDLGQLDDTFFLVMEYVHGCSLAQLMRVLGKMHRRLSPLVAVAIAARVAEGLHAAHETTDDDGELTNLVHRDVSPQNILLSHKGHVKLIDFGVAKAELRSEKTNVAMLKGKVRYMAPEQATTGNVDRRSDIYALGIVLWEMLTMRRLFAGKTEFEVLLKVRKPKIEPPSKYVSDIPRELDDVVLSALSADPDERPKTAKSFRRMLARALPRSMALDSAHLADLMLSIVGDQLEEVRHELPQEVSRLLEAQQLRVALAEAEERDGHEETTQSAVEVMTVHSQVVLFEEDELDQTPEVAGGFKATEDNTDRQSVPPDEEEEVTTGKQAVPELEDQAPVTQPRSKPLASTAPGRPAAKAAGLGLGPSSSVMSSQDVAAMNAETEEDAEPTVIGSVPGEVIAVGKRDAPPPKLPAKQPSDPPAVAKEALEGRRSSAMRTSRVKPIEEGVRAMKPPVWGWIAAVMASVILGVLLALFWPFGDDEPADPPTVEAPPAPLPEPNEQDEDEEPPPEDAPPEKLSPER